MSRMDELIANLCPEGIKYRSIGSMISRIRERGKNDSTVSQVYVVSNTLGIVRSEEYHDNEIHSEDTSNYTIIRPGMFAYNPSRLNIGSLGLLKYNEPGLVSPMYVVFDVDRNVIDTDYLLYNLKSSYVRTKIDSLKEEGARFRFDFKRWDWIEIPVPPIDIQHEIVRILDKFNELTATLENELSARIEQYEYYRHKLLSFDDDTPMIPLSEVAIRICSGKNKNRTEDGAYPVYGSTGIISYSDTYAYDWPQILVARVGANAGFVHLAEGKYDVSDNTLIVDVNSNYSLKYVYYLLQKLNLNQYAKGGGQPLITAGDLKKLSIPMPTRSVQEKIVEMLDTFDALCSDTSLGLPAEINARQLQFEYYRDKLLAIKEKQ